MLRLYHKIQKKTHFLLFDSVNEVYDRKEIPTALAFSNSKLKVVKLERKEHEKSSQIRRQFSG